MDKIKPPETSQPNELISKYSPFIFEIRRRIIITLCIFAVAVIVGFVFYEKIVKLLIDILSLKGVNVAFTSPFQFISLALSCGIATGLIVAFPLSIYQILSFLKPALKDKEYKMIIKFLPFSLGLFLVGFSFGVLVMRWQIQLFLSKSLELGIGNLLDISRLISTVILISAFMGAAFQSPIILLLLMRIGLIKQEQLSKKRLWVYLGSFLITIFLPLDSILADILLALPLIILFELTLILNRIFRGRK